MNVCCVCKKEDASNKCKFCSDLFHTLCITRDKTKQFCDECILGQVRASLKTEVLDFLIHVGKIPKNEYNNESFCLLDKKQDIFSKIHIGFKFNKDIVVNIKQNITKHDFCDYLVYTNIDTFLKNIDQANTFPLSHEDYNVFKEMKSFSKHGYYQGVKIAIDNIYGQHVVADSFIPKNSLICEYAGEVYPRRYALFSDNDSIFELTLDKQTFDSVDVVPSQYCNIGKYISGVNNTKANYIYKVNCQAVMFKINNQNRILIYTFKDINKDEMLCLDYNGFGTKAKYDTSLFK